MLRSGWNVYYRCFTLKDITYEYHASDIGEPGVEYGSADLYFIALEYSAPVEIIYRRQLRENRALLLGLGESFGFQLSGGGLDNKKIHDVESPEIIGYRLHNYNVVTSQFILSAGYAVNRHLFEISFTRDWLWVDMDAGGMRLDDKVNSLFLQYNYRLFFR